MRDAAERAGSDCAKRAILLVARCFSLHGTSAIFYEDRRPALLLYNAMKVVIAAFAVAVARESTAAFDVAMPL